MFATVIGSTAVAVAGFLPWTRSGRQRSGLELARTLREVGLVPEGALGTLLALSFFIPALAAGVWIASLARRPVIAAVVGALAGAMGVFASLVFMGSGLRGAGGEYVALFAGIAALLGGMVLLALIPPRDGEP